MKPRPKVLLVGGDDVDTRIELMRQLNGEFQLFAAGTGSRCKTAIQQSGFRCYTYPMNRGANPIADAHTFLSLVRLIRRIRPEVVHSFDTKPCVFARLAGRVSGTPVVIGTLPGLGSLYVEAGAATMATRIIYENLQRMASWKGFPSSGRGDS